jgi:hypothetical protein
VGRYCLSCDDPETPLFLVVPGVSFDRFSTRLGPAGFLFRALAQAPVRGRVRGQVAFEVSW